MFYLSSAEQYQVQQLYMQDYVLFQSFPLYQSCQPMQAANFLLFQDEKMVTRLESKKVDVDFGV